MIAICSSLLRRIEINGSRRDLGRVIGTAIARIDFVDGFGLPDRSVVGSVGRKNRPSLSFEQGLRHHPRP
jgi:hypothetical protein